MNAPAALVAAWPEGNEQWVGDAHDLVGPLAVDGALEHASEEVGRPNGRRRHQRREEHRLPGPASEQRRQGDPDQPRMRNDRQGEEEPVEGRGTVLDDPATFMNWTPTSFFARSSSSLVNSSADRPAALVRPRVILARSPRTADQPMMTKRPRKRLRSCHSAHLRMWPRPLTHGRVDRSPVFARLQRSRSRQRKCKGDPIRGRTNPFLRGGPNTASAVLPTPTGIGRPQRGRSQRVRCPSSRR